jgi:hypothetical protein
MPRTHAHVEVRNDRMGFFIDFIADEFHITSSPYTQLKTSAASNLAGAGGRRGFRPSH